MSVDWNGDEFVKQMQAEVGKRVERAAIYLMNKIRLKLNRSQPYHIDKGPKGRWYKGEDPSRPGEAPKKVRGDLQRSITYSMSEDKQSAKVGTNVLYGLILELGSAKMAPRPFLRSTILEENNKIQQILGAE